MHNKYLFFPQINPIIFNLGPIHFHWYGLMYLLSFIFTIWISFKKINKLNNFSKIDLKELLFNIFLGIFIGGRMGYVLFYNPMIFISHPLYIFEIWNGGMSFHGGFLGVIIAIIFFVYKRKKNFFQITDFFAPIAPFGLGLGRIGNFINCELWGRVEPNISWAMLFPNSYVEDISIIKNNFYLQSIFYKYHALPRHPSQIYEFILEGIVLFIILNLFVLKSRPVGSTSGLFMILYGCFRFFVEFFREPDNHIGLFLNTVSLGQILSFPMIVLGCIIIIMSYLNILK